MQTWRRPSFTPTYPIGGVGSCTSGHTPTRGGRRPKQGPREMKLDSITVVALVMVVGWTMAFAGVKKRALELKRRRRVCPSCGRRITGRVCDFH